MKGRPILFSGAMVVSNLAARKTNTRRLVKCPRYGGPPYDLGQWNFTHLYDQPNGILQASFEATEPQENGIKSVSFPCPYGKPGDLLWVRENLWATTDVETGLIRQVFYPANQARAPVDASPEAERQWQRLRHYDPKRRAPGSQVPSIHMPRWASRLTLELTRVEIERLHDITEADAQAEGIWWQNVIVDAHANGGRHTEVTEDRFFYPDCPDDGFGSAVEAYEHLWRKINGDKSWDENPWVWSLHYDLHRCNIDTMERPS